MTCCSFQDSTAVYYSSYFVLKFKIFFFVLIFSSFEAGNAEL